MLSSRQARRTSRTSSLALRPFPHRLTLAGCLRGRPLREFWISFRQACPILLPRIDVKRAHYLLFAMSTAAGACWAIQRNTEKDLRARLAALHADDGTLARLRQEHARIQASWSDRDRQLSGGSYLDSSTIGGDGATPRQSGPSLRIGSWAAPGDWRPCGNATPDAAIESTLCAAAHGDLSSLKATVEFDGETLAKAESILADLPESSRKQYASPTDLLAVIVAGSIPLDSAQLVARQDDGTGNVTEYVRLKNADGATRQVSISLHQGPEGWRVSMPANVTDLIGTR